MVPYSNVAQPGIGTIILVVLFGVAVYFVKEWLFPSQAPEAADRAWIESQWQMPPELAGQRPRQARVRKGWFRKQLAILALLVVAVPVGIGLFGPAGDSKAVARAALGTFLVAALFELLFYQVSKYELRLLRWGNATGAYVTDVVAHRRTRVFYHFYGASGAVVHASTLWSWGDTPSVGGVITVLCDPKAAKKHTVYKPERYEVLSRRRFS